MGKSNKELDKGADYFAKLIRTTDDKWKELSPKDMYYFLMYCLKQGRAEWVEMIRSLVKKRMEDRGMVENEVLGWVFPEELEQAGVSGGQIRDLGKFRRYMSYKIQTSRKEVARENHEENRKEYIDKVLEQGEI